MVRFNTLVHLSLHRQIMKIVIRFSIKHALEFSYNIVLMWSAMRMGRQGTLWSTSADADKGSFVCQRDVRMEVPGLSPSYRSTSASPTCLEGQIYTRTMSL